MVLVNYSRKMNKSVDNSGIPTNVKSDGPDLRMNNDVKDCKSPTQAFIIYSSHNLFSHLQEQSFVTTDTESKSMGVNDHDVEYIKVEEDPLQIENDSINSETDIVQEFSDNIKCESPTSEFLSLQLSSDADCDLLVDTRTVKKDDLNKSLDNSEIPTDVKSDGLDFRINNDFKDCKSPAQAFIIYNSHNLFSHLQEQSFVATDTESESMGVNDHDVGYIKVEEDPLQIENNSINSETDIVQEFSDNIKCESPPSEFVSLQLSSNTNCDLLADTRTVQYKNKNKVAYEMLVPINNLRLKSGETSKSEERESYAEEVQGNASTKLQSCIRNVTLHSASENHGKENQSDPASTVSADENDGWEECESSIHTHSSKQPLNVQLAEFYKYNCKICEPETVSFYSFFLLRKHYRLKHNTRGYVVCCERKLLSKALLVSHMLKHIQPGIYKCHECGKELANELTYEKHMIRHLPEHKRPFKCEQCLKGFASKAEVQSHERVHLPDAVKLSAACDKCGKKFTNQGTLICHQRYVHEKVREAMCHICPKTFPNRSALKGHLYTHVAKSEHKQCHECGKWLKNVGTLRSHMKSHSNQQFRCPHCDKEFNRPQSLRDHMQSHSDLHPHECLVCGKTFKRKQGLKTHSVQHTGERPYQCQYCCRTFASSGNCYAHMKRMHASERAETIAQAGKHLYADTGSTEK